MGYRDNRLMKKLIIALFLCSARLFASQDPCTSDQTNKQHVFANISSATTTSLVAVPANPQQAIFVCSVNAQLFSTTTASTIKFVSGTGAACSSPTDRTATYTNASGATAAVELNGSNDLLTVPLASGFCATTTVGSTPAIAVDVTFVLQ